jgi:hypothetical protein
MKFSRDSLIGAGELDTVGHGGRVWTVYFPIKIAMDLVR